MGSLYLPSKVADERAADELNAEVDRMVEGSKELLAELKSIDPTLSLVLVNEQADPQEFDYPGYWYIRKRMPIPPDEFFALADRETGAKLEPGLWILDWLNEADLYNPRIHRNKQEAKEKLRTAKTRAKKLRSEQRRDEMRVAWRAAMRVNGNGGMTRNASRKGAR